MRVEFDPESHQYTVDGVIKPSVTTIIEFTLQSVKNVPDKFLLPAANRGNVVHRATELMDLDLLDWDSVKEDWHGYLESWQKFKDTHKVEVLESESILYHDLYQYCGTLDRICSMVITGRRCNVLIDLKTRPFSETDGIQTAAYKDARIKNDPISIKERMSVHLQENGSMAIMKMHTKKDDMSVFLAMLKIYRYLHR